MAADVAVDHSIIVNFAQKLAGNEKKFRDRAVKKLRKWIETKSNNKSEGFNHEDLLKLWKGLHYCMWMSDKSLVQEELSRNLSCLIHSFKHVDTAILFVESGLETQAREWSKLDRLRLDKFMMFVRHILQETLKLLQRNKWKPKLMKKMTDVLEKTVCSIDNEYIPDGIRFHFADIYLDELERIGAEELTTSQVTKLLTPYINMISKTPNPVMAAHLDKVVFGEAGSRVVNAALRQAQKEVTEDGEEEEEDSDAEETPSLQLDLEEIANKMFALASSNETLNRNRKIMYAVVTRLRNIAEGNIEEEEELSDVEQGVKEEDIDRAARRLTRFDQRQKSDKPEKRKRNDSDREEPVTKKKKNVKAENTAKEENIEIKSKNKFEGKKKKVPTATLR